MINKKDSIDFVVLWVDNNDLEWQKQKSIYQNNKNSSEGNSTNRYRDWGIFHYMFRAFETFTPWVNNIYLVTCGHYPKWINLDHPKLKLIRHEDFIPSEYLPTFSSHTIELNIHRIPGLSEKFVYFNDDTFPIKPLSKDVFFKNNLPRDTFIQTIITPNYNDRIISNVQFNDLLITSKYYKKTTFLKNNINLYLSPLYGKYFWRNLLLLALPKLTGFRSIHSAASFKKSTFSSLWNREFSILHETCLHRFRDVRDVNQYIFAQDQVMRGDFYPLNPSSRPYCVIGKDREIYKYYFKKQNVDIICLNDVYKVDFEKEKKFLIQCFDSILPQKSEYEIG